MPLEQKVWQLLRNLSEPARKEGLSLVSLAGRIGLVGGGYVFEKLSREKVDGLSGITPEELMVLELVRWELIKSLQSSEARKAVEEYEAVTRALGVQPIRGQELEGAVARILATSGVAQRVVKPDDLCGSCMHRVDQHYANGRCRLCNCLMLEI